MKHVISLGAGVQSSTMALMAAHGEIEPMPLFAIFADTQWEPRAVYEWLEWLESRLPFPVVRVTVGNIRADFKSLPYFTKGPDDVRVGRVKRQCTTDYKIKPIERYLRREVLGLAKGQRAPREPVIVQWRGISTDEASRMKPASSVWYRTRYPLAMEHRMSRHDCLRWMALRGYPTPPRSACIGCPFHSDDEWRRLRDESPAEWEDAVQFDRAIRDVTAKGMERPTYLHRQCVPLDEADLDTPAEKGQGDLFGNECEGMCGL